MIHSQKTIQWLTYSSGKYFILYNFMNVVFDLLKKKKKHCAEYIIITSGMMITLSTETNAAVEKCFINRVVILFVVCPHHQTLWVLCLLLQKEDCREIMVLLFYKKNNKSKFRLLFCESVFIKFSYFCFFVRNNSDITIKKVQYIIEKIELIIFFIVICLKCVCVCIIFNLDNKTFYIVTRLISSLYYIKLFY